jgi:broad specificity phosphatase PhoE
VSKTIGMFARPFYFLRHGETEANASGIISGSLDVELTALGSEQAQAAARALAGEPITAIYSSPLRRARETAEPIAQALRLPVRLVPELIERSRGELEGKPRDTRVEGTAPQGSESFEDFTPRVLRGLSQVDSRVPLVVAHLGVFRVLCHTLEIVHTEGPVANALPLRFVPLASEGWKLEALPIAR